MNDKIRSLFHNCVDVIETENGYTPMRFTESQLQALYNIEPEYRPNGECSTGVCMKFVTSAESVRFTVKAYSFNTDACGIDIYENGVYIENFSLEREEYKPQTIEYRRHCERESQIEIWLPSSAICYVDGIEFGDYSPVSDDGKKNLLFYGDSLTKSAYTRYSSLGFPAIIGRSLNANVLNRGVGSMFYESTVPDAEDGDTSPDVVIVEFGGNDLCRLEDGHVHYENGKLVRFTLNDMDYIIGRAVKYFDAIERRYPDAVIVALSLVWDEHSENGEIDRAYAEAQKKLFAERGYISVDGFEVIPHLSDFRTADNTHFNLAGGYAVAAALTPYVAKALGKL